MVDAVYRILPHQNNGFAVEVLRVGALPEMAIGFATQEAASSWIAQDKRLCNGTDPFRTAAGRKWRDS